ncbi:G-D-S-L family lipolytic protein [Maribacter sp. 2304DJ31-5]|uniref:G-D-S-L family lipolytic protein n=1 Tax=Maribacter sp. 2304DJ31-5 TaxID=3386273 RepID=UPI0039BD4BA8
MKKILTLLILFGLLFISCSDDDSVNPTVPTTPDPIEYTSGTADFSTYVAIGNSLTAGFSDAALFVDGQTASFPNILASNFALAGGGSFNIPFMADNLGGATINGQSDLNMDGIPDIGNRLILSFANVDSSDPNSRPAPVPVSGTGTTEITNILSGPFNNMGVPGAKSYHLLAPGYGNALGLATGLANPYFVRFASDPNTTVLADALAQDPTFFTLWAGNNDVLGYATGGGAGVDQTGNTDPSTYASGDISDPDVVAGSIDGMLQALTANGAKGAIVNLPDITTLPYFTVVPYNPLDPTNETFGPQITTLNATFAQLNAVFSFLNVPERAISFSENSASALVIKDDSLDDLSEAITTALINFGASAEQAAVIGFLYGQARQANENDLIVLPSQSIIAELNGEAFMTLQNLGLPAMDAGQLAINGITYPLEDKWVLTPSEQQIVQTTTTAYNMAITNLADQYDLAFVDANTLLGTVAETGIQLTDGSIVTATYATGGGFSLDGVHPSPRGQALLANLFTKAINTKYGSNLPDVDPLDYTGLYID